MIKKMGKERCGGKAEGERTIERHRHKCENDIKMNIRRKGMRWHRVD